MANRANGKHFKSADGATQRQPAQQGSQAPYTPASDNPYASAPKQGAVGFVSASPASKGGRRGSSAHASKQPKRGRASKQTPKQPSGKKRRNVLSTVLIVVGVVLLLVAGGMWGYAQWQYHVQDENNEKLAAYATVSDDPAGPPTIDWEGLKAVNADVCGWIYVPGTHIDFPVYQGDTNDTYLRASASGEYSVGGQIFMDCENSRPGLVDRQTLLYGHHLNNGAMFTDVDDMASQENFDKVDTVWYLTEDANYELEPLFFYKSAATNGAARQISFASDDDFHTYLADALAQATAKRSDADTVASQATKVLTLCTCDYENDFGKGNGRGLLVCALKSDATSTSMSSNE